MAHSKTVILNASLADLRRRIDTLAKSIFLIGGGAVTLSVNLYISHKDSLKGVIIYLRDSWWYLLASIFLFSAVIGLLILQGYYCAEFYRKKIRNREIDSKEPNRCLDLIALVVGVVGFVMFFIGMIDLVKAAVHL